MLWPLPPTIGIPLPTWLIRGANTRSTSANGRRRKRGLQEAANVEQCDALMSDLSSAKWKFLHRPPASKQNPLSSSTVADLSF